MQRLLVFLALSQTAAAQALTQRPVSQNPVSPADMTARLEKSAINTVKVAPKGAARGSSVDFCWASSPDEYRALAKHVVLVSASATDRRAGRPNILSQFCQNSRHLED